MWNEGVGGKSGGAFYLIGLSLQDRPWNYSIG